MSLFLRSESICTLFFCHCNGVRQHAVPYSWRLSHETQLWWCSWPNDADTHWQCVEVWIWQGVGRISCFGRFPYKYFTWHLKTGHIFSFHILVNRSFTSHSTIRRYITYAAVGAPLINKESFTIILPSLSRDPLALDPFKPKLVKVMFKNWVSISERTLRHDKRQFVNAVQVNNHRLPRD